MKLLCLSKKHFWLRATCIGNIRTVLFKLHKLIIVNVTVGVIRFYEKGIGHGVLTQLYFVIKTCINSSCHIIKLAMVHCNSRVLIGLQAMVYELIYHRPQLC